MSQKKRTANQRAAAHTRGDRTRDLRVSPAADPIRCTATLLRPQSSGRPAAWTFLRLPADASARLPTRGQTCVEGTFNSHPFRAPLEPDGAGGHWLKVDRQLRAATGVEPGDVITLEINPAAETPEPKVPPDLRQALAAAPDEARATWADITPRARRDWIHWITSAKQSATRTRRVANACDMLSKGKRRPCCFDRSGMYSKRLSCPEAEDERHDAPR